MIQNHCSKKNLRLQARSVVLEIGGTFAPKARTPAGGLGAQPP